jgi:predicted nucleic acid-binding protein
VAEAVVLDTSACLAFLEDEAGADVVETYLLGARNGQTTVHVSFVTLTEVEYITTQEQGQAVAVQVLAKMRAWPVRWHHSDDDLCGAAAKLKAAHRFSFADSFVAALAQRLDAMLVHKDTEFAALQAEVRQHALPPKSSKPA